MSEQRLKIIKAFICMHRGNVSADRLKCVLYNLFKDEHNVKYEEVDEEVEYVMSELKKDSITKVK